MILDVQFVYFHISGTWKLTTVQCVYSFIARDNIPTQSTLRPTFYRKTGNYIHSGNTTQIYTDRVTAQPQSHAHYYIWSACCIYSSTKSKYSSSMDFFQFSRPHNSKHLDCLYSMLEPCILSVVWTLEKPST